MAINLSLTCIDAGPNASLRFQFAADGESFVWDFGACTFAEFLALLLGGRLGGGDAVHFDEASVSLAPPAGRSPRRVVARIDNRVSLILPAPGPSSLAKARR